MSLRARGVRRTTVRPVRRWIVIGRTARADGDFSLDDLPSTSGRLDVLLRAVRAHCTRRPTATPARSVTG
jgi:hypothetical protein